MYRKYYNSSYYIAKTQENSPDRQNTGQYQQQPLVDSTNLQINQQQNRENLKDGKTISQLSGMNLKQKQNNIGNYKDKSFVQQSISFLKACNNSQKRVKTLNNTPEKINVLRPSSFQRNNLIPQKNEILIKGYHQNNNSNTSSIEVQERKQNYVNQTQFQSLRARSNSSMVVQKMNIQNPIDTLKAHKAPTQVNPQQYIEQYSSLNKLLLNKNNISFKLNNSQNEQQKHVVDNRSQNINNNPNNEQYGNNFILPFYNKNLHRIQNKNTNNKLYKTLQTENDIEKFNTNSDNTQNDITQTIQKEAIQYLQNNQNNKSRKTSPYKQNSMKSQTIEQSQYTFERVTLNLNDENQILSFKQKNIKKESDLNVDNSNRVNESSQNNVKNVFIKYPKNTENYSQARQVNSSLSTYGTQETQMSEGVGTQNDNKVNDQSKTAYVNNFLEQKDQSHDNTKHLKPSINQTSQDSSYLRDQKSSQFNYTLYDHSRKRQISPFNCRPIKRMYQNQYQRTISNTINNENAFTDLKETVDISLNGKQQVQSEQLKQTQQSKEKLKKMQLNFLNGEDNSIKNENNLLKQNIPAVSNNEKLNALNENEQNNLLNEKNINNNQQQVSSFIHKISKRSQSFGNSALINDQKSIPCGHSSLINEQQNQAFRHSAQNNEQQVNRVNQTQKRRLSQQLVQNKIFRGNLSQDNIEKIGGKSPVKESQNQRQSNTHKQTINTQKVRKIDISHSFRTRKGVMASNPKKQNQDSFFISDKFSNQDYQQIYFLGVMDGHGSNGHLISQFIKNHILQEYKSKSLIRDYKEKLLNITDSLNSKLANSPIDCMFSGTTLVSLLLLCRNNILKIFSCNCGDSRAIMGLLKSQTITKQNNDGKKSQNINSYFFEVLELSRDHKPELPGEKERILQNNGRVDSYKDEKGNQLGPMRVWLKNENIPGLAMSRSIGDDIATSVGVTWEPEVKEFNIQFKPMNEISSSCRSKSQESQQTEDGEKDKNNLLQKEEGHKEENENEYIQADSGFIVIGSDGVWEFLSNEHIVKEVGKFYILKDIEGACNWLLNEAYQIWTREDDSVVDDITFIILFLNSKEVVQRTITTKNASKLTDAN